MLPHLSDQAICELLLESPSSATRALSLAEKFGNRAAWIVDDDSTVMHAEDMTAVSSWLQSAILIALTTVSCARVAPARVQARFAEIATVDGHNDFIGRFITGDSLLDVDAYDFRQTTGQTDLERWRAGGVAGSFVTVAGAYQDDVDAGMRATLDLLARLAARYPERLTLARTAADVRAAQSSGKVALIPHIEGGEQLGGSLERLRTYHALGVRSIGLTWNRTNDLADAANDTVRWGGLSSLGEAVVREMNRLGVLIDLSHAADQTVLDVLALSQAPVFFSHSSARALTNTHRNVSDDILRRLAAAGGVVMVTFVPYLTTPAYAAWYAKGEAVWDSLRTARGDDRAAATTAMQEWEAAQPPPLVTLKAVADHIDHVRRVAGVDHVGIGSDFDGMFSHVTGLQDVSTFPALFEELTRRGWTREDLRKVASENILRVMAEVERVAARTNATQKVERLQ